MKAAFKWRLQNGLYGYITDESGNGDPFAYDIAQQSRIYSGGTIIPEYPVDEGAISTSVSKMSKQSYTDAFNKFKQFINSRYPQLSLLDVIYYYNMENDECTASATSLKCSATDIIFEATAVTGDTLSVTVDNEQSRPDEGDPLKYRLDFVFPIDGGGGSTNTNRQVRVNGDMFIENTNTTTPINLSAGTNVTLTTGASGTVTIKAEDTWRPVRVNGRDFISSDSTTSLQLTAGTNVTLITGDSGTVGIKAEDTWRRVKVNGENFLTDNSFPLSLTAGTNVTLITGDSGTVGIKAEDTWRKVRVNGYDFLTDKTFPLSLTAGTNVTLTTGDSGTVGINFTGGSSTDTKVTQEVLDQDDDDFRPMILGVSWNSHNPPTFQTKTDKVYACDKIYSCVDTGYMYANNYYLNETPYGRISVTDMMPTGSIIMWPGSTAPTGWLICSGNSIAVTQGTSSNYDFQFSRSDVIEGPYFKATDAKYRKLLKIIGSTYGMALEFDQGSAMYHATGTYLPDFRGMFPVGAGQAPNTYLGTDSQNLGWNFHLGQNDPSVGEYKHKLTSSETGVAVKVMTDFQKTMGKAYSGTPASQHNCVENITFAVEAARAATNSHNNTPPFIVLNFIIKYA